MEEPDFISNKVRRITINYFLIENHSRQLSSADILEANKFKNKIQCHRFHFSFPSYLFIYLFIYSCSVTSAERGKDIIMHRCHLFNAETDLKWPRKKSTCLFSYMDRVKRIWYLSPMRAAKVQASLRIRAVSPEPPLLAHTSSESRGTFRQKARSLAPLNGWACAVKVCHDGMLEDTNSLDGAHIQCLACLIVEKSMVFYSGIRRRRTDSIHWVKH